MKLGVWGMLGIALSLIACGPGLKEVRGDFSSAREVFVKTGEAELFCRVLGEGDPIIVVHGGPGLSQEYLLPQMAKLAEKHLLIFYDQRASGRSTGGVDADCIQVEKFLSDLEAIRQQFGYKKVILLGHSWGAFLAMQYAALHPTAVEKLILSNSHPFSCEGYSAFLREFEMRMEPYMAEFQAIQGSQGFFSGEPETVQAFYRVLCRRYCYDPAKADLMNWGLTPVAFLNGLKIQEIFDAWMLKQHYDLSELLGRLEVPTLIIHGDVDPVPLATARELHEKIKGSQFVVLEHCGHFPHVEVPEMFFEHLEEFLK